MTPATRPREPGGERLLLVEGATAAIAEHSVAALPRLLAPGDLLVVNDAATLPAALAGRWRDERIEVRLAGERDDGAWDAVLLGDGDWRARTEDRPPPPRLGPGDRVQFAPGLEAVVTSTSPLSPRLVALRFAASLRDTLSVIYRVGRPVQYSHLSAPLQLAQVQTRFAGRPWAVEMPSAGRLLTGAIQRSLRERGVALAALTHAAGLSSTGDAALDAVLPLPERFDIPPATVAAVAAARARGGRVIAVGTTVVRALEGSAVASAGRLRAGPGRTDLHVGPGHVLAVVDGLLTGIHEPGTSHHLLLGALASPALLERALARAEAGGFQHHEFGDAMLLLARRGADGLSLAA